MTDGSSPLVVGVAGGPLDSYTNKSRNRARDRGCPNASRAYGLRSSDGHIVPMPCRLNSCLWCYRMKSFERAQMIYEDALVEAPSLAITFTTRSAVWDGDAFRKGRHRTVEAMRNRFGRFEYVELIEQTTGRAVRSGGARRGHGHMLVKMVGPDVLEVERVLVPIWERATGAWHLNVAGLASAGGAVAYLTLNLALEKGKESQAPTDLPKGTRTMRTSRGYWSEPVASLRARARDHHGERRFTHALVQQGYEGDELLDLVVMERTARALRSWEVRLVYWHPTDGPIDRGPVAVLGDSSIRNLRRPVDLSSGLA